MRKTLADLIIDYVDARFQSLDEHAGSGKELQAAVDLRRYCEALERGYYTCPEPKYEIRSLEEAREIKMPPEATVTVEVTPECSK